MSDSNPKYRNESYTYLIDKYKHTAYTLALRITGNEQDAEEAVQDAFVKVFTALQGFRGESQFSTWFYRIVYNTAISRKRKHKLSHQPIDKDEMAITSNDSEEKEINSIDREYSINILQAAMQKLNTEDFTLITLFYFEEKSLREISEITGISRNYLKVVLQRVRKKLLGHLNQKAQLELKTLIR